MHQLGATITNHSPGIRSNGPITTTRLGFMAILSFFLFVETYLTSLVANITFWCHLKYPAIWHLHSENHTQTHIYFYASRSTMLLESGDVKIFVVNHFLHSPSSMVFLSTIIKHFSPKQVG
jgi:hypothetical protein